MTPIVLALIAALSFAPARTTPSDLPTPQREQYCSEETNSSLQRECRECQFFGTGTWNFLHNFCED